MVPFLNPALKVPLPLLLATALLLSAQAAPPVLQRSPVSQSIEEGFSFQLRAFSPSSPSVSYQWFRNDQIIPGANSPNYDLHNVGPLDQGGFRVRLETENAATWSQEVELEVTPQAFRPGMIDTSFSIGSAIGIEIKAIAATSGGNFYLGGSFEKIAGHLRKNIARVQPDGSLDLSFNATFTTPGIDTDSEIRTIAIDSKNRVIVGGKFTRCNGHPRQNIARLHPDGALDLTFNPGTNGEVCTIHFDQNDQLWIGGTFTRFGNVAASRLARVRANDSLDLSFIAKQSFEASVEEIVSDGNRFYVAGGFPERIVRLNHSGNRDTTFDSFQPRSAVTDLVVLPSGELIASGRFSGGLIKLDSTGQMDDDFTPRPNDFVLDLDTSEDGQIMVSGDFTRIAGKSIRSLARLFPNGDLDESFHPPSLNGSVNTLCLQNDKLLIGGEFDRPHNMAMRILPSPPVPPPTIPIIVNQPRSQEVWPGSMVTLGVGLADSFGMTYQWFDDDGRIFRATSPQLQLLNFGPEQEGNYHVVVSVGEVSIASKSAELSLAPETGLAPRAQFEASPQLLSGTGTTVSMIQVPVKFTLAQVRPHIEIDHPKINDLKITLKAPSGTEVVLYDRDGRRGRDLRTTFDSFAPADLDHGAAPWQGTWKPDENLNAFQNRSSMGSWVLEIQDRSGNLNGGRLKAFRLEFIANEPEVDFTNWLNPNPAIEHLQTDQYFLYFTHSRWRNSPNLTYQYQALQGNKWIEVSPSLLHQENLGNNQDSLRLSLPISSHSKIIRLWVRNKR